MTGFGDKRYYTIFYYVVIVAEVLVIMYVWSPTMISTKYNQNMSWRETEAEDLKELLSNLQNEHERISHHELENEVVNKWNNDGTPRSNESYQFLNVTDIVKNLTSPILLTNTNYGFLDLLLNLLYSIQRLYIQPTILVICEDKTAYVELSKRQSDLKLEILIVLTHLQEFATDTADRSTERYISMVKQRVSYVELLIQWGFDVLYIDSDIVLLENPFKYFVDAKYDMFVQAEMEGKKYGCSGFFFLRANNKTKRFVTSWRRGLVRDSTGNQHAFNSKIKLFQRRMKVKVLPTDRFMSGKVFFKSKIPWFEMIPQPVEVHANYLVGEGKKTNMLKTHNLWFVED